MSSKTWHGQLEPLAGASECANTQNVSFGVVPSISLYGLAGRPHGGGLRSRVTTTAHTCINSLLERHIPGLVFQPLRASGKPRCFPCAATLMGPLLLSHVLCLSYMMVCWNSADGTPPEKPRTREVPTVIYCNRDYANELTRARCPALVRECHPSTCRLALQR